MEILDDRSMEFLYIFLEYSEYVLHFSVFLFLYILSMRCLEDICKLRLLGCNVLLLSVG